jgi:hypothetical protein
LVYISESEKFDDFNNETGSLLWRGDNIIYGNWDEYRITSFNLIPSEYVKHNGSLYAHVYLTPHDTLPQDDVGSIPLLELTQEEKSMDYKGKDYVYQRIQLTRFMPRKRVKEERHLLTPNEPLKEEKEEDHKEEIISYWYQNLTLNIITEQKVLQLTSLPPQLKKGK